MKNARFSSLISQSLALLAIAFGLAGCSDDEAVVAESNSSSGYSSQLDSSFGSRGVVITSASDEDDAANAVAIQADGKIVVAGYVSDGTQSDFLLLRYDASGSLDSSFGTDGQVVTDAAGSLRNDVATAVAVLVDGSILVAGYAFNSGGDADFAVAKYDSTGALDTAFDTDGIAVTDFTGTDDLATAIAVQADGTIVLAGSSESGSYTNFALARYGATGALDAAFDTDGKATSAISAQNDAINAIAIQVDGKIVAVGSADGASDSDFAVARFTSAGALDTAFETDGKLLKDFAGEDVATSVALDLQSSGGEKIVVAGRGGAGDFAVARFSASGSVDTGFNLTGSLTADFGEDYDHASGIALTADGEIYVAGYSSVSGNYDFALGLFLPDGSRNRDFGKLGLVTTEVGAGHDIANAVAVSGSKVVVVGKSFSTQTGNDVAVATYEK